MKIIEATGQLSLAYLAAKTHGLEETAERLLEHLVSNNIPVPAVNPRASLLQPPTPILRGENWPLLAVGKSALADLSDPSASKSSKAVSSIKVDDVDDDFHDATGGAGSSWGNDDDLFEDEVGAGAEEKKSAGKASKEKAGGGWGDDDDLDLSDDEEVSAVKVGSGSPTSKAGGPDSYFTAPSAGNPAPSTWCAESTHCADHFAAGSVESAIQLLNRQIAAVNVSPVKQQAIALFLGSTSYLPGLPSLPANRSYIVKDSNSGATATGGKQAAAKTLPVLSLKVTSLLDQLKQAYRSFTNAQFAECQEFLESIIKSIPLIAVSSRAETNDLKELLDVSREYLIALRVKEAMGEADTARSLELAAYFTHCNLQPAHLTLALKTAMASAFKSKNFVNAASFARRLLEMPDMSSEKNADARYAFAFNCIVTLF